MKTYLDIETAFDGTITVVGLYRADRGFVQFVAAEVSDLRLWQALEGSHTICTYNGDRFDLPVIRRRLGLDLSAHFASHDLMVDCWRLGLKGGLKRVEALLGLQRTTVGVDGLEAMRLWHRYETVGDRKALSHLLAYNREDVLSLEMIDGLLRERKRCG